MSSWENSSPSGQYNMQDRYQYHQNMMYQNYMYTPDYYQNPYQGSQPYVCYDNPLQNNSDQNVRAGNYNLSAQSRQFIPTMVYQSNSASNCDWNGGNNSGWYPNESGRNNSTGTVPRHHQYQGSNNMVPGYRRGVASNSGMNRLYRNPRHVNSWNSQNHGNLDENTKLEGRKKLLAEAASLLTGDQGGGSSRGWESGGGQRNASKWNDNSQRVERQRERDHSSKNSWRNNQRDTRNWKDHNKQIKQDSVCQRERLMEQLCRGSLECLVCCERIKQTDPVWACVNCHHVLHLRCTVKWASTSMADNGWRCPACQNVTLKVPSEYRCMCGKVVDPQWVRGETPHCCGQTCGKSNCAHQCTLLCHPGPCPPCAAIIDRKCGCGRTSQMVQCASNIAIVCDTICQKLLKCQVHECSLKCHQGDCPPCSIVLSQECYCGNQKRETVCNEEEGGATRFRCEADCPGSLTCGLHPCLEKCHPGTCSDCPLSPDRVTSCPCGKKLLEPGLRKTCKDPIPTCGQICGKLLSCGQPGSRHRCQVMCHEGDCPDCPLTTSITCRCGYMEKEIPCPELTTKADDARCQKKCSKKRNCGKHKCNQMCCIELDHLCPLPCNKTLSCGRHKCQQLCHRGHCLPCTADSFEELRCECGKQVILPPVACGTRPPECNSPCPREHPCSHPPTHNCHSQPQCPPCTVLTSKFCHGNHELRKTIPCHLGDYSCGRPCGKALKCGHKCIRVCHKGACLDEGADCIQACGEPRPGCGHPCSVVCHPPPCPNPPPPCTTMVRVTCQCGRRTTTRTCSDNSSEYHRIATSLLASKMADVQLGLSVDPDIKCCGLSKMSLKTLECNDECKTYERNLRLAIGLQIANPDLSSKLHPRYSDSMKAWAKKDPRLCQLIHDKLTQLVQLAKESKQKSRSYSFDPMNRDKRQLVHEYCKHFGVESMAYDTEPKRNIVATASKGKCWLPSYSLLEVVQRENGQRKVPLPSLKKEAIKDVQMKPLQKSGAQQVKQEDAMLFSRTEEPQIDYFEYNN